MRNTETPGDIVTGCQVFDVLVLQVKPSLSMLVNPLVRDQAEDWDLLLREQVQGPDGVGPAHSAGVGHQHRAGRGGALQGDADYTRTGRWRIQHKEIQIRPGDHAGGQQLAHVVRGVVVLDLYTFAGGPNIGHAENVQPGHLNRHQSVVFGPAKGRIFNVQDDGHTGGPVVQVQDPHLEALSLQGLGNANSHGGFPNTAFDTRTQNNAHDYAPNTRASEGIDVWGTG